MALFSLPGEVRRDSLRHYQSLGIGADLIDKTSNETVDKEEAIRMRGTNVDLVIPSFARDSDGTGNKRGLAV